MNNNTLIVFHRCGGKSLDYPPDTLLTIKWAIDYGAKAIEYDVVYCNNNGIDEIIVVEPKLLKSAGLDITNLDLARKLIRFNINRFTIDNPEQL